VAGVASGPATVLDICPLPGHMPPVTNPRRGRRTQGRVCEGANVGVCQSAAAAVVVGGVFVVEQLRGCCGSGLGTGTGLAVAPSADSGSPLATGTQDERSRRGFSDFSRLL